MFVTCRQVHKKVHKKVPTQPMQWGWLLQIRGLQDEFFPKRLIPGKDCTGYP